MPVSRAYPFAVLTLLLGHAASARAQAADPSPRPGAPEGATVTLEAQIGALVARPGGLTADQAAARARSSSFDVKARRADASAARAGVDQAGMAFIPRVTARASYMRISDVGTQSFGNFIAAAPGTPLGPVTAASTSLSNVPLGFTFPDDNYALSADLMVPISDYLLRIADQYVSAKHSARASELTAEAAERNVATNARIQYYGWARSRLQLVVAEAALELARLHLNDARSRFAEGQSSRADVLQVEAQLAERELWVERARSSVAVDEDRLRTSLHDPAATPYAIGEPLLAELPSARGDGGFEALLERARRQRLELRAVRETSDALHAQARAQRWALLPRLDGVASALYANPNPRYFPPPEAWHGSWSLGASLSWTSSDAIMGGSGGSAASARADGAAAQEQALAEGIRDELMQAYTALHDTEVAVSSSQRSLAAAEESYRVRRSLFRAAQATSTELGDAENALTRARFDTVNAHLDLRIAHVRMTHALGDDAVAR